MSRLAIVSAIGSRGDVNPMLALGRRLKTDGWEILFLTSAPYVELAVAEGFRAHELVDEQQFRNFIETPGLWNPLKGIRVVLGEVASQLIEPTIDLLQQHYRPGETLLVTHPLDFGSRVFRDVHPELPHVGTVLAPMAIRTPKDPSRLTPWWFEIHRPSWLVQLQFYLADVGLVRRWLGKPLNRIRRKHGLAPISRPLKDWYLSPDLVLGLYPDWFSPSAEHLPGQLRCTGFPLEDAGPSDNRDESTLQNLDVADRPLVIAPGTANTQAKRYLECCARACQALEIPTLLLTEHPDQLPKGLPDNIRHARYAPFRSLLPHCRGIVHHGGIGTSSQALAAGIPQIVAAMAFDQFDNGRRIAKLGSGILLPHRQLNHQSLSLALKELLDKQQYRSAARSIAERFVGVSAMDQAMVEIEKVVERKL